MTQTKLYKTFRWCGLCRHWDGGRLGFVSPAPGAKGWYYVDESGSACCNHPEGTAFEMSAKRVCGKFESR